MSLNKHNIDPEIQAALSSEATQALREKARSGVEQGPLPSLQIALAVNGKLALFDTFGEADNNTRYNIFSCTKPLVASAIWLLMGREAIDIARPVAHDFTELGDNGKEAVTIEQLLCHTSGFPTAPMAPRRGGHTPTVLSACAPGTSNGSPAAAWSITPLPRTGHWRR